MKNNTSKFTKLEREYCKIMQCLTEDKEDIRDFKASADEPTVSYESVLKELK